MPQSAISLLAPAMQKWTADQHWAKLRPIQEKAIPVILRGGSDVIISAATASGKTEAAFLPIGSLLTTKPASSLGALCLSPLKALINNQAERLAGIFRDTGVPVTAWHGDAGWETKRNFLECPRGILLITPESLETLLMRHNTWCRAAFSDLRYVVIDEFHDFLSGERGWQTQSLLKRIESKVHRPVPRIALSATLGDIGETENFLRPGRGDSPCVVIDDEKTAARPVIQVRGYTHHFRSPWAKDQAPRDERLIQDLFTLLGGKNNLIFTNSRSRTEQIAGSLSALCREKGMDNEFFPHHGSLARHLRLSLEKRLQEGSQPTTAVCTKTLELGIDIGSVDSIAQVAAPWSVASLRQRLGRSGRRGGRPLLRLFITENVLTRKSSIWDMLRLELFQSLAMLSLLSQGRFEPLAPPRPHFSTLVQQIISVTAQYGGVRPSQLWNLLCKNGPFRVSDTDFIHLLHTLADRGVIRSAEDHRIELTDRGLAMAEDSQFSTSFSTTEYYELESGEEHIGALPLEEPLEKNQRILFAGRFWKITDIDEARRKISLEPAQDGLSPRFSGGGAAVHDIVRREMLKLYRGGKEPGLCDFMARKLFDEGANAFRELGLLSRSCVSWGEKFYILPWLGDRTTRTISALLRSEGLDASDLHGIIEVKDTSRRAVMDAVRSVRDGDAPDKNILARNIPETLYGKFDSLLPAELRMKDAVLRYYDLAGALSWIKTFRG